MKKLLVIVILGLLLSGNAYAENCWAGCGYKEAKKFPVIAQYVNPEGGTFCVSCYHVGGGYTAEEAYTKAREVCMRSKQVLKKGRTCVRDGIVKGATYEVDQLKKKQLEKEIKKSKIILNLDEQEKKQLEETLNSLKQVCRDIGYSDGTEKFADCVKDLYVKKLDAQNSNLSQNITTTKKRSIDPSVWDDLGNISKDLLGGKSLSESLGGVSSSSSSRKITCFKTGEETGGLNKICRYDCVGNLVTTTVGAAQMCPIQIQK